MKPWKVKGWVIPPKENSHFVAHMEQVLDVYKEPYSSDYPLVCMDESPKQLIGETRIPIQMKKGREKRIDYEYHRCGVANIFIAGEPLRGKRLAKITPTKKKRDWAVFVKEIAGHYREAKKIRLVMDNYGTHTPSALYETFQPEEAKRLWDRFEFIYTPKHGSWLNMAEIELNVLTRQCLNRRMDDIDLVKAEVQAWQTTRNNKDSKVDWQFTTDDARIKLKSLYPKLHI